MFDNLQDRMQEIFKGLKSKGKLSEKQVEAVMREIRLALLEADVNFKVVKSFVSRVKDRSLGSEVMESLTPAQQVIKIVNEEIISTLGGEVFELQLSESPPVVLMIVGLQGSGKTTMVAKLAKYYRKKGRHPMMIAADIYRPAAIDQLKTLGKSINIDVYGNEKISPVEISKNGIREAAAAGMDLVLIDTAGRLHIDEEMMTELKEIKKSVNPHHTVLVVDAMTGQDAVNVAESFKEWVDFDGVALTKLDGDARGGAALSIRQVTDMPILFSGTGEKLDDIELFYPERVASRILGMGDIVTLIDKAQEAFDREKALKIEEKIRKKQFTLEDFLDQMNELKKMGSMDQVLSMIPGFSKSKLKGMKFEEDQMKRMEAVILSMTMEERVNPSMINSSRKKRIAAGSGTTIQDINRLLQQFQVMQKLVKQMGGASTRKLGKMFPFDLQ